jgi:hypothetical protein
VPNFLGWLVGVFAGVILVLAIFVALALPVPALVGFLAAVLAAVSAVVGTVTPGVAIAIAVVLLFGIYIWAYAFATASVSASLPAVAFPLTAPLPTPTGAPIALPDVPGELFARGLVIGLTATLNAAILSLLPVVGPFLAAWAFIVISLAAVILIARNLVFQGFLGWSAWLFPISYIATVAGVVMLILNLLFSSWAPGFNIRPDWTTGVIETRGAFNAITGFAGGFSLGNFTFLTPGVALGDFAASNIPSHEVGHSLNTAAMGGVVLWINALDQNVLPRRSNLAYGELLAESRSQAMTPPPSRARHFFRFWS